MSNYRKAACAAFALGCTGALGQGVLETPHFSVVESGIGQVMGWHCTAKTIEIQLDNFHRLAAGTGTERNDTIPRCGHGNTGFSLTFNYNILAAGNHTLVAYADGVEFARTGFRTVNPGVPYLTGVSKGAYAYDFPAAGSEALLFWDERKQNFGIADIRPFVNPLAAVRGESTGLVRKSAFVAQGSPCIDLPGLPSRDYVEERVTLSIDTAQDTREATISLAFASGQRCEIRGEVRGGGSALTLVNAQTDCFDPGSSRIAVELTVSPRMLAQVTDIVAIKAYAFGASCVPQQWLSAMAWRFSQGIP